MSSGERFSYLFYRYFNQQCTLDEKDEFMHLVKQGDFDVLLRRLIADTWNRKLPAYEQGDEKAQSIFNNIVQDENPVKKMMVVNARLLLRYAAIVIVALSASLITYRLLTASPDSATTKIINSEIITAEKDDYIILPDSSKVLLHKGGNLTYDSAFTGNTREVFLTGEAYFDIRHNQAKPFIVHTGNVKTIVLGTAFNVNAANKKITVTVTRGRVKVENNKGDFGIIRPNEQITVDPDYNSLNKTKVVAEEAISWKKDYLLFNDITMQEAADEIQQRFHTTILFGNPGLKDCHVTAYFIQQESLEQVIKVLARVNNMEYTITKQNTVELSGEGCR